MPLKASVCGACPSSEADTLRDLLRNRDLVPLDAPNRPPERVKLRGLPHKEKDKVKGFPCARAPLAPYQEVSKVSNLLYVALFAICRSACAQFLVPFTNQILMLLVLTYGLLNTPFETGLPF